MFTCEQVCLKIGHFHILQNWKSLFLQDKKGFFFWHNKCKTNNKSVVELKSFSMKIDLKANEMVVKASDTKYLNGSKVRGKMILTNQRIYFKVKDESQTNYELEITPAEIKEVIPFKTGLFSNDGLNIVTKEGSELTFSIDKIATRVSDIICVRITRYIHNYISW